MNDIPRIRATRRATSLLPACQTVGTIASLRGFPGALPSELTPRTRMVEPTADVTPSPAGDAADRVPGRKEENDDLDRELDPPSATWSARLGGHEVSTGSAENVAVRDNPTASRYELLYGDDLVGEILYRLTPDAVFLVHTEVLASLEGEGFGARLVAGALDDIRGRGLHVVPVCPFVSSYIRRHPDYRDLVVRDAEVSD